MPLIWRYYDTEGIQRYILEKFKYEKKEQQKPISEG